MESGKGNAKRGCGRWMEECGRGAAVVQLTARGMVSIPAMGAIEMTKAKFDAKRVSIPAMGGNSRARSMQCIRRYINPRNGGQ